MTVCHHPADDLLLSYAAGALAESWSLAVAAHLSHCPACRRSMDLAENVGAALLQGEHTAEMSGDALDRVLSEIDTVSQDPIIETATVPEESSVLPQPLRDYVCHDIDNLPWQRLGNDAAQFLIETSDNEAQARLLRIKAGKPVPSHGHGGRELTLVLSGSFHDEISEFGPGDLEDLAEETVHKPVAGRGEDCLCLAVTDAPLKFNEFLPRLLQPLFKI